MDWILNNWLYIFSLSLAVFSVLLATLLLTNRKYATGYAGWLYQFGLLNPQYRDSTAPARKVAWVLYFVGVLALALFGWQWYYFHKLPKVKDYPSPYEKKQAIPSVPDSPYTRPLQGQPGSMPPPNQPGVSPPSTSSQLPTSSLAQPAGREEPPLVDVPPLRTR